MFSLPDDSAPRTRAGESAAALATAADFKKERREMEDCDFVIVIGRRFSNSGQKRQAFQCFGNPPAGAVISGGEAGRSPTNYIRDFLTSSIQLSAPSHNAFDCAMVPHGRKISRMIALCTAGGEFVFTLSQPYVRWMRSIVLPCCGRAGALFPSARSRRILGAKLE